MIIHIRGHVEVAHMPGGVVGQISFRRLIEAMRKAGEITASETITHLRINVSRGAIEYRVETTESAP